MSITYISKIKQNKSLFLKFIFFITNSFWKPSKQEKNVKTKKKNKQGEIISKNKNCGTLFTKRQQISTALLSVSNK